MPDSDGNLTEEEKKRVVEWLKERWPGGRCPICDRSDLAIEEGMARLPVLKPGFIAGGPYYPLVVVHCQYCANEIYFNAVSIGITPPEKTAATDGDE